MDENTADSLDFKADSPKVLPATKNESNGDNSSLINLSIIHRLKQHVNDKKLTHEKTRHRSKHRQQN